MPERSESRKPAAAALSPEERGLLLRALAAFLQATPAPELPASVRRFRTFRPAALGRHETVILRLLDDPAIRARLLEWLGEGKPPLSTRERDILRVAAERGERWAELVAAGGAKQKRPARDERDEDERAAELGRALEREKAKTKKARADARAARSDAAGEVVAARREADEAIERAEAAERRLVEVLRRAEAAEAAVRLERERGERELRRARRDLDRLKEERAAARAGLRDLRAKVKKLEREAEPGSRTPRPRRRRPAPEEPTGPRRPLPVSPGRLEDAPETLDEWLEIHGVHLVVDGYNVTMAEGGFGGLELERQRDRLIAEVTKLVRRKKASATIVFDGRKVPPGTARLPRGPVKVEYSRSDEIADDHIVALVEGLPPYPVIVATNDRELQERTRYLGATVATSDQLLGLIR